MRHRSTDPKPALSAIFVQHDREEHPLALERFVDFLYGLGVDFQLVVVDNAHPGSWFHEVSKQIVQVGGEDDPGSASGELSAFDRGLDFAAAGGSNDRRAAVRRTGVYAFASDAFVAGGEEILGRVDAATLELCLGLGACGGSVDSWGEGFHLLGLDVRDWMRAGLFLMPGEVLRQLGPLATPFDPASVFGPDPGSPFLDSAPLSRNLQSQLLARLAGAETGGEAADEPPPTLDLTEETFGIFQHRACAIVRELLLSARLQSRGVPCFDFRLLRQLERNGVSAPAVSGAERKTWSWSGWKEADVLKWPRYSLEELRVPKTLVHGEPVEMKLAGWVAAEPQPREVLIRLSNGEILGGRCEVPRGDVLELHPEFVDELCGFEIRAQLDHLPPGSYAAEWSVPELRLTEDLGKIQVLPRCDFEVSRRFIPESVYPEQPFPIAVEGELVTSHPLAEVRLLWDGEELDFAPELSTERRRANGLHVYKLALWGRVSFSGQGSRGHGSQHRLELEFHTEAADRFRWKHYAVIAASEALPHNLSIRRIGERDPRTGLVSTHLKGAVLATGSDARLVLMRDGHPVFEEPLSRPYQDRSVGCFDLEQKHPRIPPGWWTFSLALKYGDGSPEVFARWRDQVRLKEPRVEVDSVDVQPVEGHQSRYLLKISGWIHNHFLVDRLLFNFDGKELSAVFIDQLAQELPYRYRSSLVKRQGFYREMFVDAESGDHTLQLLAVQEGGNSGSWERKVFFPEPAVSSFWLHSADLEAIDEGRSLTFWSSIVLRGELTMKHRHVVATLHLDGEAVMRKVISDDGFFHLNYTPRRAGCFDMQVTFEQEEGLAVYRSGVTKALFRRVDIPEEIPVVLARFIRRFELERLLNPPNITELSRLLIEKERESLPELVRMLRSIGSSLEREGESAESEPGYAETSYAETESRRLKVLFASWEVPCSRHGGGVLMVNHLKRLSEKHDITVVHPYSGDEKGLSDEIRDYVSGVISVPRDYHVARYRGDHRIPRNLYDNYTPELQAAVQAEIFSQQYDLVNYEYAEMYPYISGVNIPQVIDVLEDPFSAVLYACEREQSLSRMERVIWLEKLLQSFYFFIHALPGAARHIITVTEEDAEPLRAFQGEARVHVNTIGVGVEGVEGLEIPEAIRADYPTFVFLGNYRHPPNVDAALFYAKKVMPQIRGEHPEAQFLVIGSHPTEEIQELDELPYVRVTGFVPDFRPYLAQASAFVAPIKTGAGMRVKVLEAMACGVPVIGTALAMQGIGATDGAHFFGAESAEEFAAASAKCIAEPDSARRVGREGGKLIAEKHSYEASAAVRERIWQYAVEEWQAKRRGRASSLQPQLSVIRGAEGSGEG